MQQLFLCMVISCGLIFVLIGNDCSQLEKKGFWEVVEPSKEVPLGSASHCSVLVNDYLWVFGGSRLNLEPQDSVLQRYDFKGSLKICTKCDA